MRCVFFDLETELFGPGNMAPEPIVLSWCSADGKGLVPEEDIEAFMDEALGRAVREEIFLAAHNAAFDFRVLLQHRPKLAPKIWEAYKRGTIVCTEMREKLLDINEGKLRWHRYPGKEEAVEVRYNLGDIIWRKFRRKLDKSEGSWRTKFSELRGTPIDSWPEEAVEYVMGDSINGYALYIDQEKRCIQQRYTMPTQGLESRAALGLGLTSCWGIKTDPEKTRALHEKTLKEMYELEDQLILGGILKRKGTKKQMRYENEHGIRPKFSKNMLRIKQLVVDSWMLPGNIPLTKKFAKQGEEVKKGDTEKAHMVKTDADTIDLCDAVELGPLQEYNKLVKAHGTYILKFFEGFNKPIHPGFDPLGAASSRSSSFSPNMQNQPRLVGLRECFRARSGRVFIACDFDAQEMRTLAQNLLDICDGSKLATRFQEDPKFDPHLEFACARRGWNIVDAKARLGEEDPEVEEARQHAKIANFGLPGGMGVRGLIKYAKGYGVTLSELQAAKLKSDWLDQWPEMNKYFEYISHIIGHSDSGTAVIPQSGFRRGMVGYCDASNTFFQSLAAHASKASLFEACRRMYFVENSPLFGSRPVNFVHDEIMIETLEEFAHGAAKELQTVMVQEMQQYTPDIPAAASAALMRNWSKKAKPAYNEEGLLIPWEDRKAA